MAADPAAEEWSVSRHEWTHELVEGSKVAIVNTFGDVRVRDGKPGEIYVLAIVQRHPDDPRVATVPADGGLDELRLAVRYPDVASLANVSPPTWVKRRVDLTVFVPSAAMMEVTTKAGLIEIRGIDGDVELRSVGGDLELRTTGGVRARTDHGDIFAQPRRTDWRGQSELETLTGEIRVELPRSAPAEVQVQTRGEITTDYSMEIRRADGSQLKLGTATIGRGGGILILKSNRGAIRLIESMVPEKETT